MSGTYPTVRNEIEKRTVNYSFQQYSRSGYKSRYQTTKDSASTEISVANCGDYFVFELPDTPACNYNYCGAD